MKTNHLASLLVGITLVALSPATDAAGNGGGGFRGGALAAGHVGGGVGSRGGGVGFGESHFSGGVHEFCRRRFPVLFIRETVIQATGL